MVTECQKRELTKILYIIFAGLLWINKKYFINEIVSFLLSFHLKDINYGIETKLYSPIKCCGKPGRTAKLLLPLINQNTDGHITTCTGGFNVH